METTNFLDSYIEFFPQALEFSKTIAADALQELTEDQDIDIEELKLKAETNTIKLQEAVAALENMIHRSRVITLHIAAFIQRC